MLDFLFGNKPKTLPVRLVVGLNQVDKLCSDGWNSRLNAPSELGAREIKRRSDDIITKLSQHTHLSNDQFEYYSALKRYRLTQLIAKLTRYAFAGFRFDDVAPADPFDLADDDVRQFANEQRAERAKKSAAVAASDAILQELTRVLSPTDLAEVTARMAVERTRPPKVAFFGKAGVGKSTTVNNLFSAHFKTSHTVVGTTQAQHEIFDLPTGGTLSVVDLPGYGRTIKEDEAYERIYRDVLPECDVVFLAIQADSRDLADDEEMILKIASWLKDSPRPLR